jgi:hypothetical protein
MMTTEKKSPVNEEKSTSEKPIELNEGDLEQVKGGTGARDVVEADPCAGGRAR